SGDTPETILGPGHGEWSVQDHRWRFALVALMTDRNDRFVATVEFAAEGQLSADGRTIDGTVEFTRISGDTRGQGSGTLSGERIPLEP
ncbi:MAG: hypothetical protein ACRDJC_15465, partial [Thermomicrobiales bacterium]